MSKNKFATTVKTYIPVFLFIIIGAYTVIAGVRSEFGFTFEYQIHAVLLSFVAISFLFKYPATLFTTLAALIIGLFFPSVFVLGNNTYYFSFSFLFLKINVLYVILLMLFISCNYKLIPDLIQWAFISKSSETN